MLLNSFSACSIILQIPFHPLIYSIFPLINAAGGKINLMVGKNADNFITVRLLGLFGYQTVRFYKHPFADSSS